MWRLVVSDAMCNTDSDTTTTDATSGCCGVNTRGTDAEHISSHWIEDITLNQQLPDDLRTALGDFFGAKSVNTLNEWGEQIRRRVGGDSINVDHLCHTDRETDHWGELDGERYHFQCFYDAVILAALEMKPVDIHTVSPGGVVVKANAVGDRELSVTPGTAVFSFGIARDAHERSSGNPTLEDAYAAICPYVKAFPDRDAYMEWADNVPAATVATPLSGATVFARALTAGGNDG